MEYPIRKNKEENLKNNERAMAVVRGRKGSSFSMASVV